MLVLLWLYFERAKACGIDDKDKTHRFTLGSFMCLLCGVAKGHILPLMPEPCWHPMRAQCAMSTGFWHRELAGARTAPGLELEATGGECSKRLSLCHAQTLV